ncbi:RNA polymerase sigma factor [Patulibacter minatonensis]|uniref:RNA polymerase sigma factor n=1 Tax=Patulibacter minatonensis TaxID=298163 RepID=UPI0004BC97D0|nr:RNA polymerase sigma factor [Patulibacter minatonensis]
MSPVPEPDDARLLARVVAGDERAFDVFYRRHQSAVIGFHLRRTGRRELAFDLTAETFATVVATCDRFDPERGAAVGWLFGIAANKLRESLRRGRVESETRRRLGHQRIVLDDADLERVDELASETDEALLHEHLAALPTAQRTAILARVVDERPYPEIAAELQCSEAVVRKRVARGLSALRTRLEGAR